VPFSESITRQPALSWIRENALPLSAVNLRPQKPSAAEQEGRLYLQHSSGTFNSVIVAGVINRIYPNRQPGSLPILEKNLQTDGQIAQQTALTQLNE